MVNACLRHGDLSGGWVSRSRALDGIREHTRLQAQRPDHYHKEVFLSSRIQKENMVLDVYGRADGIFQEPEKVIVEEIKTCSGSAGDMADNPAPLHLAQLKCYGHMVTEKQDLDRITLQLTYVRTGTRTVAYHTKEWDAHDLKRFFNHLAQTFLKQLEDSRNWIDARNSSIDSLDFPYPDFRENQRLLAESVYKIIKHGKILFARAPTGTGKTIATLFPAIKSLGLGQVDKIFYLTAKTVGRAVAQKAIDDMRQKGAKIKSIALTAKQKICFISDESCDYETCPYAKNYYAKLNHAMKDIRLNDNFDRVQIEALAQKFEMCPFELSLDISMICDVIICDLNYCFDPKVYLRRYFDGSPVKSVFLTDEAHNLQDRLRSMYSAELLKSDVLDIYRILSDRVPSLCEPLLGINKWMQRYKKICRQKNFTSLTLEALPEGILSPLAEFSIKADQWLDANREACELRSALTQFYFKAGIFLMISGFFDTHYRIFVERRKDADLAVCILCLDPSAIFTDLMERCRSCILFSATLHPVAYHRKILLSETASPYAIELPSCFSQTHLGLFIHSGIQTVYSRRQHYHEKVAGLIRDVVKTKKGNYLVYFPSYAYMHSVLDCLDPDEPVLNLILVQQQDMTEQQRQEFLDTFATDHAVTGFAVMGGIFGEGIDLAGDRLIGTIIVSAGVPRICPERNMIKDYYDSQGRDGFSKAYQMPGFNRVLQAAGRVIRTETDKGIVILVDQRFTRKDYRCLFPYEWQHAVTVSSTEKLIEQISLFWQSH